jgi:hypothetical protein
MIPEKTTLEERLEFYEWALKNNRRYICNKACKFYKVDEFEIKDLKILFPELYKRRDKENSTDYILWLSDDFYKTNPRIEALQKAIIEVKRKIEKR